MRYLIYSALVVDPLDFFLILLLYLLSIDVHIWQEYAFVKEQWATVQLPFQKLASGQEGFTATGIKKGQIFVGDISTQYSSGKTIVDVKVDTYSSVSTKVTYDVVPGTRAAVSFNVPDHKSGKVLRFHIFGAKDLRWFYYA
ncbi:mitochondrial outer membrane protein porin 4-like [Salvia splendens]|uniref:mitochondrial outer membrane protein porin 4-like n=1 Tax=Salvia splendens TaxID=180675 RepID=UPI001C279DCF|nr:mitochondrial outer membrane protein porin 4-like [Salvia splendens]